MKFLNFFFIVGIFFSFLVGCQTSKPKSETAKEAAPTGNAAESPAKISTESIDDGPQAGDELNPIYFSSNSSILGTAAVETLKKNAEQLKSSPRSSIQIEGHCDQYGSDEYNFLLGERRATAAKNLLIKMGIEAGRMKIISYGKDKAETGMSEAANAKSRRASFVFLHQ